MPAIIIWAVAFVVLVLVEVLTVQFVSIWLALGALVALMCAVFKMSVLAQIIIFIIVSSMLLLATRPFVNKFLKTNKIPTNSDLNIGKKATVIKEITLDTAGRATLDGVDWIAIGKDNATFLVGEIAVVERIDSAKLVLKKNI